MLLHGVNYNVFPCHYIKINIFISNCPTLTHLIVKENDVY